MLAKIKNLVVEEEGQGLSEYGLLLAAVVGVVAAAVLLLSDSMDTLFKRIGKLLNPTS
ncbi:Flp family type IVb pilin [Bacillus sp. AFS041924]|uniref:Flp family type IVb pilin n=1 Tax=Bacillus sp. AFS041924 TaxID=2033503 RepID=UPI000BFB1F64|nr:Flp family type IVb pilin [Bacillus sp. AFS041924]PGS51942.1 Flp family type IVb pilin [Bacillus sp. AFS041924]